MAIAAAKAGKDIWCEKPMSRTIGEGIAMVKAVEKHKRIFRLNTWFRFQSGFYDMRVPVDHAQEGGDERSARLAAENHRLRRHRLRLEAGRPGPANPACNPNRSRRNSTTISGSARRRRNPTTTTAPIGTFRGYWDYDGGGLGDMGQHYLDPVQYILNKDDQAPISVEIDADPQDAEAVGIWRRIEFTYADGCKVILDGENKDKDAAYMEGPKGRIYKGFESDIPDLRKKIDALPDPAAAAHRLPRMRPHPQEIRPQRAQRLLVLHHGQHGRHRPPPEQEPQVRLQDPQFDDPAANALIHQPMRAPWELGV